jgi:NAD(P)-dependent dehydrogenase (short-subunit alcohol dehydrogenase family)
MAGKLPEVLDKLNLEFDVFKDQVVLITGGGRGIGRESALAFAHLGARLVIAEISREGKEVEQIILKGGGEALYIQTDVSAETSVNHLKEVVYETFGPVHILVNNAILCPAVSVLKMEVDQWDKVMAVNLRGAFLTSRAFLPEMLKMGRGTVLNMVSTEAMPFLSAYIASKQGLSAFSRSLAAEVGESGVKVIAFAPGFVATPGLKTAAAQLGPHMGLTPEQFLDLPLHPAYQGSMPVEDAAGAAVYLAARLASEYHGEVTDGYSVLEKAGYLQIQDGEGQGFDESTKFQTVKDEGGDKAAAAIKALEIAHELSAVIKETEEEFQKLPIFVRPLARSGFKNKSGESLSDWKRNLDSLSRKLHLLKRGEITADIHQQDIIKWNERLDKLKGYYKDVPAETARFTKDPEFLHEVKRKTVDRINLIESLKKELSCAFSKVG